MPVRYDLSDGVATVTLDEPAARNRLDRALGEALLEAVARARRDEAPIVLAAIGPAFCAGGDLDELAALAAAPSPAATEAGLRAVYAPFLAVLGHPYLTVAAVDGPAVGAGVNLALACDVRLAGPSARFECRFATLGIHQGGGHGRLLVRAVGAQAAAAMLLADVPVDAARAVALGLALEVADDPGPAATALARRAARVAPELAARMKASLRAAEPTDHGPALAREASEQAWSFHRPGALQARNGP